MTTLREAAQMALDAMLNFPDDISDDMFESIKALRAALAQTEQEPVWGDSQVTKPEIVAEQKAMNESLRKMVEQEPPQREWQGLTPEDKRIAGIPLYTDQISMSDAFDVIERILKEKNCAPDK